MQPITTAVIGGSGLVKLAGLEVTERQILRTPYGEPSSPLLSGLLDGYLVSFLARHGHGHTIPPHRINYRANLWALKDRGIRNIVATGAVGAINPALGNGALVIPDQLLDYTYARAHTFHDGESGTVNHIDFTHPFTPGLRSVLLECAGRNSIEVTDGATCAVVQGPRLETAAEIRRFGRDGADLVGMTSMPEASLARELGMHYILVALVVNPAAGLQPSPIRLEQVLQTLEEYQPSLINLISRSLPEINAYTG